VKKLIPQQKITPFISNPIGVFRMAQKIFRQYRIDGDYAENLRRQPS
jgi:hypothetical protein